MRPSDAILAEVNEVHAALKETWSSQWLAPLGLGERRSNAGVERATKILARLTRDPEVVPHVMDLLTHRDARVTEAVADFVRSATPLLSTERLASFEVLVRRIGAPEWWRVEGADVEDVRWPAEVLALLSMHPSGYVRERAVKALRKRGPEVLRYLLLRLNDWVDEVREPAEAEVRARLALGNAELWAELLPFVARLQTRSRGHHAWVLEGVEKLLLDPQARPLLMRALASPDRHAARAAFGMSLGLPPEERSAVIQASANSPDGVVRLKAVKYVRAWADCPGRESLLTAFASDPFAPIRLEVFYERLESEGPDRRGAIEGALMDHNGSVREAARFHYKRLSIPNDPRRFYLDRLAPAIAGGELRAAGIIASGIGETGTSDDLDVVMPLVAHPHVPLARAAALAALAMTRDRPALAAQLLEHRSGRVVSRAGAILAAAPYAADTAMLRALIRVSPHTKTRRRAAQALLARHPYDCYPDALDLMEDRDAAIAEMGRNRLYDSRFECPQGPSAEQVRSVREAMDRHPQLDEPIRRRVLRVFGIAP